MKRLAICYFGMSYREALPHWEGEVYKIDARACRYNHDKYIVSFFKESGYEIDYYLSTNDSEHKVWFLKEYNPVYANFDDYSNVNEDRTNIGVPTRAKRLLNVLNACLKSNSKYDTILAIRFDLLICKPMQKWSIDFDNFNVLTMLERPKIKKLIDDNIYILNDIHLENFISILSENQNVSHHNIYGVFCKEFKKVNLMYNEGVCVPRLTSVKILRTLPDGTNCISIDGKLVPIDIEKI